MNVLICDDVYDEMVNLSEMVNGSGFRAETVLFDNGADALSYIRSGAAVDVCFLDIVMPKMSGVALAEKLRGEGYTGGIIFLTSSNEYAAESYQVDAFSYLLKPPTPEDVRKVMQRLDRSRKDGDTDGLPVRTFGKTAFLLFRDISHIEVIQHKVYFRLADGGEIETNATFGDVAARLLEDDRFIRCHRSFVVNMGAVSAVTGREITMRDGAVVPISKSYPDVKKKYLQWVFGGNKR